MRAVLWGAGLGGCLSLVMAVAAPSATRTTITPSVSSTHLSWSYDFSPGVFGQSGGNTGTLSPVGGSITIESLSLSGANGASFAIGSDSTCVPGLVLAPSLYNQCNVDIVFTPQTVGSVPESLTVVTNVGTQTFDITTSALATDLLISPTVLDFGFQPIGTESATRTVTIKNPNPVAITVPSDDDGTQGDFNFFSGNCLTVAANSSCSYQLTWTPNVVGKDVGYIHLVTAVFPDYSDRVILVLSGQSVQDGAAGVSLEYIDNVNAVGTDGQKVQAGGLDGYGNVYSSDFVQNSISWAGQLFRLGDGTGNAIRESTITLPSGRYFGLTLLGTGVNGSQMNQSFTVKYSDGTTSVLKQSLSDWKTPQHYLGESIALTMPYRLTVDGTTHTGPYYLYAYLLPLDHTKTAVSLTLPNNRNVSFLAINAGVATIPVTAYIAPLYNVTAVGVDGTPVTNRGIDHAGTAVSLDQFESAPLNELLLEWPAANVPDAIANVTVPLPSGQYSTLHLDGMAVNGNKTNATLTINYQDGTSTVLTQSFSDWHTPQKYTHESVALAMTYKLNANGSKHPGTYNIYQYDIPIDAARQVASLVLPKTSDIVLFTVALKP
jgi:hypothetical protein